MGAPLDSDHPKNEIAREERGRDTSEEESADRSTEDETGTRDETETGDEQN